MQLSEKDKQALQEKIKQQRQAMWSGKQSTSEESEEKTAEADQGVNPSGDTTERLTDAAEAISSDVQSDSSTIAADQAASMGTTDGETNQEESSVQTEPDNAPTPITEETGEQQEEEEEAREDERVFWETSEQEGGPIALTWKLVLAIIGVAVILVGVGVYLGFLFAG